MRSRKPCPGAAVTRTTSQSESSLVPPVTALRSPPDSRITGALSPVTALSSTEATPSTVSPSLGMVSPHSTRKKSPSCSSPDGIRSNGVPYLGSESFLAFVSCLVRRSAAACALPLPSASASEKLANSTHSHSHRATPPMNDVLASPCPSSACIHKTVVRTLPTSVTNITGFLSIQRGFSLTKASTSACR